MEKETDKQQVLLQEIPCCVCGVALLEIIGGLMVEPPLLISRCKNCGSLQSLILNAVKQSPAPLKEKTREYLG
jgi:hypothetical protein